MAGCDTHTHLHIAHTHHMHRTHNRHTCRHTMPMNIIITAELNTFPLVLFCFQFHFMFVSLSFGVLPELVSERLALLLQLLSVSWEIGDGVRV